MAEEQTAYSYQAPDRRIYDMLFGTGTGGFGLFPQVQQYYQSQFENLGEKDSNPFTYSDERIAGFSPREEYAMQLADAGIGAYAPFLARAQGLTEEALAHKLAVFLKQKLLRYEHNNKVKIILVQV